MKIVVVGGNGFIGSHFVAEAVDRGHDVIVCGRSMRPRFAHGRPFTMLPGGMQALIEDFDHHADADIICQFASSTIPATSNADPIGDVEDNLVLNIRLFEAMRRTGRTRIVYLSSGGAIYGVPEYTPMDELHPQTPISSYGVVKGAVERYLGLYAALHGFRPAIVRPANPYGPGQATGGQLGAISTFLNLAGDDKPITLFGDGSSIRDFVFVSDLTDMLIKIAEQDVIGTFNCGGGEGVSLIQLVDVIADVIGRPLMIRHEPARAFDPHSIVLDIRRAAEQLGWTPSISLKEGVMRTWESLRAPEPLKA